MVNMIKSLITGKSGRKHVKGKTKGANIVTVQSALAAGRRARLYISKAKAGRRLNAGLGACAMPNAYRRLRLDSQQILKDKED
jgi:hypothetical protein